MAIAFGSAVDGGNATATSLTFAFNNVAGDIVFVGGVGDSTTDDVTGATYNGVAMTLVDKLTPGGINNRWSYLFYLVAPATGSNNVVVSASGSHFLGFGAVSYTGASQTGVPDATNKQSGGAAITTLTTSVTTIADNCWTVLLENSYSLDSLPFAGTGATRRTTDNTFGTWGLFDSNAAITPAGGYSMQTNRDIGVTTIDHVMASFKPAGGVTAKPYYYFRNQ